MNPFTPNFENAKVGDECFSVANGYSIVNDMGGIVIANDKQYDFELQVKVRDFNSLSYYDYDGRALFMDKHPTLFNSFQQFMDYWQWEKEKDGSNEAL